MKTIYTSNGPDDQDVEEVYPVLAGDNAKDFEKLEDIKNDSGNAEIIW